MPPAATTLSQAEAAVIDSNGERDISDGVTKITKACISINVACNYTRFLGSGSLRGTSLVTLHILRIFVSVDSAMSARGITDSAILPYRLLGEI